MALQIRRNTALLPAILALLISLPLAAQTKIVAPKNKYTPQQDVELGHKAAAEVRQKYPLVKNGNVDRFVERIGERLVDSIPDRLQQPAFRYTFDVVNMADINAFALPGGPMFLNRGMIEAARTDGEVAGVMAHELSHVILRHGTAQVTKGEKFQIGAIAGQILGSIVGGRAGDVIASGSQFGLSAYFLKYGREYERQADVLGAQLMADAGYEPRHMANMFRTIQERGGNRGPEWLSSHPDPGNRYEAINREAASLRVDGRADTADEFESARESLARMPPAPTPEQIARGERRQQGGEGSVATSGRAARVAPPSSRMRNHRPVDFLRLAVPENWKRSSSDNAVTFAPEGGYDQTAFTHGLQIGVTAPTETDLRTSTTRLIEGFAESNPRLRRQGGYKRTTVSGRQAYLTTLKNVSDSTGDVEAIDLTTVQLSDGRLLYLLGVAPMDEADEYFAAFNRVRGTVRLKDR